MTWRVLLDRDQDARPTAATTLPEAESAAQPPSSIGQAPWQTQEKIFGYAQSEHKSTVKMRILIDPQSTPPEGFSSPIWYNDMVYQWGKIN